MKYSISFLLLSTLSVLGHANLAEASTDDHTNIRHNERNLIVGGNVVPSSDGVSQSVYPYLVKFRYLVTDFMNITDPFMNENGSGAIIKVTDDALIVLTANVLTYEGEQAYIGAFNITRAVEELEEFTIVSIVAHPDILDRLDTAASSLVMMKLSKPSDPSKYKAITNLNYGPIADGTAVTVMGHGQTTPGNLTGVVDLETNQRIDDIDVLHDVELSYLSPESCKAFNDAQNTTLHFGLDDTFCLVSNEAKSNCYGDDGSPAIIKGTDDPADDILLGFVFLGNTPECGVANQTDVYQSIAAYKDWIEETTEILLGNVMDNMTMAPSATPVDATPAPIPSSDESTSEDSASVATIAGGFLVSLATVWALM